MNAPRRSAVAARRPSPLTCFTGSRVPRQSIRSAVRASARRPVGAPPSGEFAGRKPPGPARNAGVAAATADILAFIDADCRAHPGWVSAAVGALEQPSSTGVVGGDVQIDLAHHTCMTGLEAYESVFAYRQALYIHKLGFSGAGNLAMRRAM